MKKILFALLLIPTLAFAQEKEIIKEYCIVALEDGRQAIWEFKQKPRQALILMEDSPNPAYIANREGERLKFNNTIHLINYMCKQGWELHSTRTVPERDTPHTECLFWRYKEVEVKSGD